MPICSPTPKAGSFGAPCAGDFGAPVNDCPQPSGGDPCGACPDEMPPAFVVSFAIENKGCTQCTDYDGMRFEQHAALPCFYVGQSKCGHTAPQIFFSVSGTGQITAQFDAGGTDDHLYLKNTAEGENCNKAHTLASTGGLETDCTWPDELTITPSA